MLLRVYPDCGSFQRTRSRAVEIGVGAAAVSSNSEARVTPRPFAIFASTTAVGLVSPRSTSESIERLTPQLAARVSRLTPAAPRRSRTRPAMRAFISGKLDMPSSIQEVGVGPHFLANRV